ncbi:ATPase synthesis protein 25, mitochondrial [Podospora didyma]|uniref:ATPase synthesis protein 25 n=1 Tax=Podospora didyma TaxID=330526 RepID=A0AAE0U339_9PEZI|nr:ATPase synthesis protein 25, mitochondrial [Podospora didyma]
MGAAPALRAAGCSACRFSALRLFVGGGSAAPKGLQSSAARSLPTSAAAHARYSTFRATPRLLSGPSIEGRLTEEHADVAEAQEPLNGSDVPWYLEVEPPRHPTLLHEPAPLPEIPEGSPRLMEPLLKFVAEELGFDELTLLDLRAMDPAPAFGSELLMLFGSARSERHLHVSADRLVRWLRGRGIMAKADGLLGRNELKTKLRRKARKAKLLGNSGVARGGDDGISTGWVCINLGTIGRAESEEVIVDESGSTVGFGVPQLGTTLVVQMMTEERRQELDLERLWNGQLKRSLARHAEPAAQVQMPEETDFFETTSTLPSKGRRPKTAGRRSNGRRAGANVAGGSSDTFSSAFAPASKDTIPSGSHFYSTSSRRLNATPIPLNALAELMMTGFRGEESIPEASELLATNGESKAHILGLLRAYLESLPKTDIIKKLTISEDGKTPPFLSVANRVTENIPPAQAWEFRLWLERTARSAGHPDYDMAGVRSLVKDMHTSSSLSRQNYLDLIQVIYTFPVVDQPTVQERAVLALEVVETMFARSEKVIESHVIVPLIESLVQFGGEGAVTARLLSRFEAILTEASMPCPPEHLLIRLLDVYANKANWGRFWDVWRIPSTLGTARSLLMYGCLYQRLAQDGHQLRGTDALRRCVEEMVNEDPPVVPRGRVVEALKACIRVADPEAAAMAEATVPSGLPAPFRPTRQDFMKLFSNLRVSPTEIARLV